MKDGTNINKMNDYDYFSPMVSAGLPWSFTITSMNAKLKTKVYILNAAEYKFTL